MKITIGVFFGGRSVEHEISVLSAQQTMYAIDRDKYEVLPIYISKTGKFYTGPGLTDVQNFKDLPQLISSCQELVLNNHDKEASFLTLSSGFFKKPQKYRIDVAFPVLHGTFGEDGATQGLFELLDLPYVGCDVLASAIGMDKIVSKMLLRSAGLPVTDYTWFYTKEFIMDPEALVKRICAQLPFPLIVKPANLGSSVGISKAYDEAELEDAIETAANFANKILVEVMISDLREINCSVLGDQEQCEVSACEEPLRSGALLSYQDKYMVDGAKGSSKGMTSTKRVLPAEIPDSLKETIQKLAVQTFQTLGCAGVSRIDFLLDRSTDQVYVNEINTIPGSLAFYLWEPVGKSFPQLVDDLIDIAFRVYRRKDEVSLSFEEFNILSTLSSSGSKMGKA